MSDLESFLAENARQYRRKLAAASDSKKPTRLEVTVTVGVCLMVVALVAVLVLSGCTTAPKATPSQHIAFDVQTGKQDGGLIDFYVAADRTVWAHTSDDFRADYVRLLAQYGALLESQPLSPDEGWILTPPIACNAGVRTTMKELRALDRSAKTLPKP